MTYMKKAINLRYIYLTLKPTKKQNIYIQAPPYAACIDILQFIHKRVFD